MDQTAHSPRVGDTDGAFRLGVLVIDAPSGRIEGPSGVEPVDPKVMDVLLVLVSQSGQLVTRELLLDAVWPDRVVTDDVLSRCIYQLRRHFVAASGDPDTRLLIETLPRRGYRLNIHPRPAGDESADPEAASALETERAAVILLPGRTLALLGILAAIIALWWNLGLRPERAAQQATIQATNQATIEATTQAPIIAVLPFVDLSAEGDQEYFADGITEELLNHLALIPDLRVIARSSSFWFKGQNPDIATVAEKLGVSHVLEGSVRRSGDRVRISAQLVDASKSLHLWSETYERELGEIFAIQDEIAEAVARALQLTFVGDPPGRIPDPEAHALHLHAHFLFNRRLTGDLEAAERHYLQALEIDPEFAMAWAGLSGVYFIQGFDESRPFPDAIALARTAAERALELDPGLPEAHARLGRALSWVGNEEAARWHQEQAQRLGADSPLILAMRAGSAAWEGRFDEAVKLGREAAVLDPLNGVIRMNLASTLLSATRLDEALEEIRFALEIRPETGDDLIPGSETLVKVLLLLDRKTEALAVLEHWPDGPVRDYLLALVHAIGGDDAVFDVAIERLARDPGFVAMTHLAEVLAYRGETDSAFAWLEAAHQQVVRDGAGAIHRNFPGVNLVRSSPLFDGLRSDPRWQGWLAEPGEFIRSALQEASSQDASGL